MQGKPSQSLTSKHGTSNSESKWLKYYIISLVKTLEKEIPQLHTQQQDVKDLRFKNPLTF